MSSIVFVLMIVLAIIILVLDTTITRKESFKAVHFLELLSSNGGHRPLPRGSDFVDLKKDSSVYDYSDITSRFDNFIGDNDYYLDGREMTPPPVRQSRFRPGLKSINRNEAGRDEIVNELSDAEISRGKEPKAIERAFGLAFPMSSDDYSFRNYFALRINNSGDIIDVIKDFPLIYTSNEVDQILAGILKQSKVRGISNGLLYIVTHDKIDSSLICIMNRQSELATLYQLYKNSGIIYCASFFVALIFAWFLADWIVKPVEEAFNKQKRFVSDAGHELKTPIAVISANLDVLMPDMPDNRWLGYIKAENERMGRLVKDLLYLARNDADRQEVKVSDFDLTNAVNNAVLPFESIIFEDGKTLEINVQEGLKYTGDEQQIKQVVIILVDNAIKNSEKGALIKVRAYFEKDRYFIRVYNTGHGIAPGDLEKIFMRFYRADTSRARATGGYGLGLAIAKTIASLHNGDITVKSEYGKWAEFIFELPLIKQSKK